MDIKDKLRSFDYILFFMVVGLSIFGIVVIGSATRIHLGAPTDEYDRQKLWLLSGLVLFSLACFIDYRFIANFYIVAYVATIGLCGAVLLWGDKMTVGGATRGLNLFGVISIQPSEFSKIFMLIYLSKLVDKLGDKLNNIIVLFLIGGTILLPVFLIIKQPSLSAAMVVLSVSVVMLFIGGVSYKYVIPAIILVGSVGYALIADILREDHLFVHLIFEKYQLKNRIIPFFKPELASASSLDQTKRSIEAIGSGQFSGKGLYQGIFNGLSYVPASHNDFVFAVIGEEFGYIGCIAVLIVLLLIILKCILTAFKADSVTGKLIACGAGFMFAFQTFVNVGVAVGLLPNTGIALPFISYGGSSMWINMIAIGLVINVGMNKPKSFFEE